jgi:hypothetical protein
MCQPLGMNRSKPATLGFSFAGFDRCIDRQDLVEKLGADVLKL